MEEIEKNRPRIIIYFQSIRIVLIMSGCSLFFIFMCLYVQLHILYDMELLDLDRMDEQSTRQTTLVYSIS